MFPLVLEGNGEEFWEETTVKFKALLLKNYGSKEAFLAEMEKAKEQYSTVQSWRMGKYIDSSHQVAVPIIMTQADGYQQLFYLYLTPADGSWRISGARLIIEGELSNKAL